MDLGSHQSDRDAGTLLLLRGLVPAVAALFIVFTPYNLVTLEAPARGIAVAHDLVVLFGIISLWLAMRRPHFDPKTASAAAAAIGMLIASNLVIVQTLTGQPVQLFYQAMLVLISGLVLVRPIWMLVTSAGLLTLGMVGYAATWPLDESAVPVAFATIATFVVAWGLSRGRASTIDRLGELRRRDRDQQRALREALHQAQDGERRLDAKVATRTQELRWANAALKRQVEERQRASHTAANLSAQLRHAQRIDAVGQLTGGVAHDFNNLITAVIGNVEMALLDVPVASTTAAILADAKTSAQRAAKLTQQLLTMSRSSELATDDTPLVEAFSALGSVVGRLLGEDIDLHIDTPCPTLRVAIPAVQLDQILLNLTVNARDAMPGGGRLTVTARSDHGRAVIEVSDTGLGMDEATQRRMFDPYFTTKDEGKGTGLGLATVASIVEMHGGHIEVRSSIGVGSTFMVELPLLDREVNVSRRPSIPPIRVPQGRGERVLVVEDEDAVRRIAVRILERLGYHAVAASSGPEAVQLMAEEQEPIDLLWTDVLMPGMDGRQLADHLHATRPELRVLFASGHSGDTLAPRGVLSDDIHFLSKPYDAMDVARAVRKALDA